MLRTKKLHNKFLLFWPKHFASHRIAARSTPHKHTHCELAAKRQISKKCVLTPNTHRIFLFVCQCISVVPASTQPWTRDLTGLNDYSPACLMISRAFDLDKGLEWTGRLRPVAFDHPQQKGCSISNFNRQNQYCVLFKKIGRFADYFQSSAPLSLSTISIYILCPTNAHTIVGFVSH